MLVAGIALEGRSCLPKLQIQTRSPTAACVWVGRLLKDHRSLIQAEGIAAHVIGTQHVHPADRFIEVVFIVAVHHHVGGRTFQVVQYSAVLLGESKRSRRRRAWTGLFPLVLLRGLKE